MSIASLEAVTIPRASMLVDRAHNTTHEHSALLPIPWPDAIANLTASPGFINPSRI